MDSSKLLHSTTPYLRLKIDWDLQIICVLALDVVVD